MYIKGWFYFEKDFDPYYLDHHYDCKYYKHFFHTSTNHIQIKDKVSKWY